MLLLDRADADALHQLTKELPGLAAAPSDPLGVDRGAALGLARLVRSACEAGPTGAVAVALDDVRAVLATSAAGAGPAPTDERQAFGRLCADLVGVVLRSLGPLETSLRTGSSVEEADDLRRRLVAGQVLTPG